MAKNLVKRLGKGLAIAGASALAYLPMNSDADIVNVRMASGNPDVSSSTMKISHKSGGEEYEDSNDSYWHTNNSPPGSQEQNKFLRTYSNQIDLIDGTSGWEMNRDNRGLTSRESFPLRFDAIAKTSDAEGTFSSVGNYVQFFLDSGADWNSDDSGIQDYAYELKIWGNGSEDSPYFTESTADNGGYGIRHLMDNNSGRSLGTFDLSSIQALEDGSTDSVGGPDYGSLTLTPSESIIPEPNTLTLLGVGAGLGLSYLTGRKRHSKKNRR